MIPVQIAQELSLIALILLYGTVLARLVPRRFHIVLNISIAVVAVLLGIGFGLTPHDMGIALSAIGQGIFIAIVASVVITIGTIIIALIPPLRHYFLGDNLAKASGKLMLFETAIRIPFSTALVEEVLFRGVLLGLLLQHYPTIIALLYASAVFGFWHVFPTIASLEQNDAAATLVGNKKSRQAVGVSGAVFATAIAGMVFGYLRILADSIVAPWLVHWSINASGVVGIYVAKKVSSSNKEQEPE